jgi:hypothetical protein
VERDTNSAGKVGVNWFKSLPALARYVIIAVAIGLALLVGIKGKDWVSDRWEKHLEAKYDKSMAAKEAEAQKLIGERDKAITEAKEAIAKAELKEQESDLLKLELAKYGKAAQDAVNKQNEAVKNYEEDKARINLDATAFERCNSLCSERKQIGYPCPAKFCDRYSGR